MRFSLLRVATTVVAVLLVVDASSPSLAPATSAPPTSPPAATLDATPPPVTTAVPVATPPRVASPAPATNQPPTSPPAVVDPTITAIVTGAGHTCALTTGGGVKCWGSNEAGQLGNGTTINSNPVDVSGLESGVVAITAGSRHTCALTSGGGVKCWGSNEFGQLGNGNGTDRAGAIAASCGRIDPVGTASDRRTCELTPVDVAGLTSGVIAISAGGGHTCALTGDGTVKCWGSNSYGQLGYLLGDSGSDPSAVPIDVSGLGGAFTAITAGYGHTCAHARGFVVKCWGVNVSGQLGNGSATSSTEPVDVSGLTSSVSEIAAGSGHTCALTSGDGVKCWGSNRAGQLGNDSTTDSLVPVDVSGLTSGVTAIATGGYHTCALTTGGGVKCWGNGSGGQLGSGSTTDSDVPVDVSGLTSGVTAIATGGYHTCALTTGGGVKCWGNGSGGQLGSGSTTDSDVPVEVNFAAPTLAVNPTVNPVVVIEHATGPTDVVLRFDDYPSSSWAECNLDCVENEPHGWFRAGPVFTLYGDGTVIFGNLGAESPPFRGNPFRIARLSEDQIQSLLRFALLDGGLGTAREEYESDFVDALIGEGCSDCVPDDSAQSFSVRAGGVDKVVVVRSPASDNIGPDAPARDVFGALADHLGNFGRGGTFPTQAWAPDRYWGLLAKPGRSPQERLEVWGDVDARAAVWPWPAIAPEEFLTLTNPGDSGFERFPSGARGRVMSREEAASLSLSDITGGVEGVYLRGPDGKTVYYFVLWPIFPEIPLPSLPPTPTPSPPTTPGPLRIDGLARVVVDRLRVRSAPEVSAASERFEPLLDSGTMLFVIDGPVAGSGYDWYRVAPVLFGKRPEGFRYWSDPGYWGDPGPIGWVASSAHDGTPWIVGARIGCPDPSTSNEGLEAIERLGPLVALSCYGDASIQFRANAGSPTFVDQFEEGPVWAYPDMYLVDPLSMDRYASFGTKLDRDRFPHGDSDSPNHSPWNVVGHFDDEAATTCGSNGKPEDQAAAAAILTCRTTFVVTDLVPVGSP